MNNDRILATTPKGKFVAKDLQPNELLLALHPYCRTPFDKLHKTNPEIIHLAETPAHRTDLTNGIALNALYGKAFDRHLISVNENFRLVLSEKIKAQAKDEMVKKYFLEIEGK